MRPLVAGLAHRRTQRAFTKEKRIMSIAPIIVMFVAGLVIGIIGGTFSTIENFQNTAAKTECARYHPEI